MNRIQSLKTELLFNNLSSANIGIDSINGTLARIRCDSLDSIDKGYPYSQSVIFITDESISSKSIEVFFSGVDY
ncbi:unnamed protein product [Rotaria sordida]|uniref:Uncharacterized protein n=1 Tax=Rotaria sordida TaxID=392033 RepID=A0A815RMP4_9BILA|nr:unnamed protein product [Rotaria sordida]CAF1647621.1 unnamed protein product [Rotaria sordida]